VAAVIDATLSGSSANSYVTLAQANTYFETVPESGTWTDKTDDEKNRALISATSWLDGLTYYGDRCTTTQTLKWPRENFTVDSVELACSLIPAPIKNATYELARALANDTNAIINSTGTGLYEQVELGDLKVKYNVKSQSTGTINNVFDVYPWLQAYLGAYCQGGSSNFQVALVRG
jgi:hypothetical protein